MHQLKTFWRLVRPFWMQSTGRTGARLLLLAVIGLSLSTVWFSVRLNTWNGAFFNAIQAMDGGTIYPLLLEFIAIVAAFVFVLVYADWLRKKLVIEWRRWMTEDLLGRWLSADGRHYRLQLAGLEPDNPDQRIAEDVRLLIESSLTLVISFLRSLLTIVSFVTILWTLSGTLEWTMFGTEWALPGYMVWTCIGYTLVATGLTHVIGRPLMKLNFEQQRREADFRTSLFDIRRHGESIAGLGAEEAEQARLRASFERIVGNWRSLMNRERDLAFFTVGFGQVTQLVPIFFALPKFLSGAIQLGGLMQIRIAFQQVASAIGWFIYAYRDIAEWSATVDRLAGFEAALSAPLPGSCVRQGERVAACGLVRSKTGEPLLEDLRLGAEPGRLTVVRGASGIGKTTLLRALAGFWPWVEGRLENRPGAVWLTQRTWLAPMPLRELLAYPHGADAVSRSGCEAALRDAGLERLVPLLDEDEPRSWMNTLSGGEQQRVLFARLLPPSFWSRTSPRSIALRTASTISENEHEQNQDRPARRTAGRGRVRGAFHHDGLHRRGPHGRRRSRPQRGDRERRRASDGIRHEAPCSAQRHDGVPLSAQGCDGQPRSAPRRARGQPSGD